MRQLWHVCVTEEGRHAAAQCYQRNIRLLQRLDVDITEASVN
jgi:hypothetical protein